MRSSVGIHGPVGEVENDPPGELDESCMAVTTGRDVTTPPISTATVIGPVAVPAVTDCGVEANPALVGVQEAKVLQAAVNAAPSTVAVHHGGAQAPAPGAAGSAEAAIAAARRARIAATCVLKSLDETPSEFDGSQAKPIRSALQPSEAS